MPFKSISKQYLFSRKFVVGTAVALAVISSSGKVSSCFEEHLISTVIGKWKLMLLFSKVLHLDAKRSWPDLIELSESMHQLFGHSYEVVVSFLFIKELI